MATGFIWWVAAAQMGTNPLTLPVFPAALEFPKFVPRVDVVADCSAAKVGVGARAAPGTVLAVPWHTLAVPCHSTGSALCLAERRGCRSPDPARGAEPAEGPGAAGQGPPLGDVSATAGPGHGGTGVWGFQPPQLVQDPWAPWGWVLGDGREQGRRGSVSPWGCTWRENSWVL